MKIMLDTYVGLYYQVQTKLLIISLKGIRIFGTQEEKSHKENSFIMLIRNTIT